MALIFPSNPTLNQVYSTGSLSWTWNGKSWNNGTSILAISNLVSSSVQFTNGNTTAFDTTSNITVGQITASFAKISGSIFGTASFAILAQTSSYVENARTASYVVLAQTASYVLNAVSASYSLTASYVALAQTASYVENAQTASYVTLAQTASYISTASYALAALSASYAPNIYVLPNNVVSASAQLSNGGGVAFDTNSNITVNQITASFAKITNLTVEYVTSSVMVITGSNKFGDASNDKQEFTGSVSISGSLSVVGNVTSNNVLSLASGTVALPSLILSTDTTSGMYRIGANNIGVAINAAKVLDISSTGLSVTGALSASGGYNGSVGATTPSTGAFTTITASGTVAQDFNGAGGNSFTARFNSANARGGVYVQGGSGKVFFGENLVHSTANVFVADKAGTAWALADSGGSNVGLFYATGLTAGATAFDFSTTTGRILSVTSTGLAVTGALSASGNVTLGVAADGFYTTKPTSYFVHDTATAGNVYYGSVSSNTPVSILVNNSVKGSFTSSGLQVTGALSSTTGANFATSSGNVGIGTTSPSQLLTFGNATAGLGVGWGDTTGNYANIFAPYSASGLVLATGFQGSRSSDAYTSSYGGSAMYRSGIRLNAFGNGNIQFFTDGSSTVASGTAFTPTERMRIDSSGNVGIGTTSPVEKVYVSDGLNEFGINPTTLASPFGAVNGTSLDFRFTANGNTNARFAAMVGVLDAGSAGNNSGHLEFWTAPTGSGNPAIVERMRILASGNVGIGTTSPAVRLHVDGGSGAIVSDSSVTASQVVIGVGTLTPGRPFVGTNTNTNPLEIGTRAAQELIFVTNSTERARIDSSGNVIIGNTVANVASGFNDQKGLGYTASTGQVQIATTANAAAMEIGKNNANDGNIIVFRKQGTTVGNVSVTGSATTYNSGSDYRLKNITGLLTNSGVFIDALKPKIGTWKSDGSKFVGFLAHEFAEVSPSSVTGQKDAVDSDGNPVYQSMQASSAEVIANLVAELQSLRQRVAALEAK